MLLKCAELNPKLFDLSHVFVLDAEVVHLDLDVANLGPHLVLFLLVAYDRVEHTLQILNFIVNLLHQLVLSLLENGIFHIDVDLLDLLNDANSAIAHIFDIFEDRPNLRVLHLHVFNEAIDLLQVLVAVHVLWHGLPLILHKFENLLFVLNFEDDSLELLLQILDLLLLVLVLNALVGDLLLRHHDFLIDGLLVLFPLLFQLF